MTRDEAALLSIARAIADRVPVDWVEAQSEASATDPAAADTVRELRIIAEIAGCIAAPSKPARPTHGAR